MRFRTNRIAWVADVEKAFLNIALQPEDSESTQKQSEPYGYESRKNRLLVNRLQMEKSILQSQLQPFPIEDDD